MKKQTESLQLGTVGTSRKTSPEQHLVIRMLSLCIQDLHAEDAFPNLKDYYVVPKFKPIIKKNIRSAYEWLFEEEGEYSFDNVCDFLYVEHPNELREKILRAANENEKVSEVIKEVVRKNEEGRR